jgi:hypothetical protein
METESNYIGNNNCDIFELNMIDSLSLKTRYDLDEIYTKVELPIENLIVIEIFENIQNSILRKFKWK